MSGFCYKYLKSHEPYHTWIGIPFFQHWQFFPSKFSIFGTFYQSFQIILQSLPWITNVFGVLSPESLSDRAILWTCISTSIHSSQSILKFFFGFLQGRATMRHLERLDKELLETEKMATDMKVNVEFEDFFQERSRYVRKYQLIHLILELLTHVFFFGGFLIQDTLRADRSKWRLPIVSLQPFDIQRIPIHAALFLWQTIAFCFMSSAMVAVDYFILDLVVLHKTHFEYLGMVLTSILERKDASQGWKLILRKWIDVHRSATRCVKSLQPVISSFLGLTYGYMIIHTCIPIFIVTTLPSWTTLQKIGVVFITTSGQTMFFLLAAAGDGLASACYEIGNRFYGMNLISADEDTGTYHMIKKFLHRRFYLRFTVIPLRRSTFSQILRLALSYYLLLHDIQAKGTHK